MTNKTLEEICFNNDAGQFVISVQVFAAGNNRKFSVGDLNGDGVEHIVLDNGTNQPISAGNIVVHKSN